jgi:site-specific DNA-methyltransferase (adenine-specific)
MSRSRGRNERAQASFIKQRDSGMVRWSMRRFRSTSRDSNAALRGENAMGASPAKSIRLDELVVGDSREILRTLPTECVHLILSDIPYGISAEDWDILHDNTNSALAGSSPAQEKAGAVFRRRGKPINGWSEADRAIPKEYYDWCASWASNWLRVLKPGGSAFVFAGRRYAHRCICALEDAGFSFKDMLGWIRGRAPHRAQRVSVVFDRRGDRGASEEWNGWRVGNLRPSFEPILWFTKPYRIGTTIADNALNFGIGPFNEEEYLRYVRRPDNIIECGFSPKEAGLHPTQKPLKLMQALIALTTKPGQVVLDPFAGSGTTAVAARSLDRHFLAYEMDPMYAATFRKRVQSRSLSLFTT